MKKILALCSSRHTMPASVEGSVFDYEVDPINLSAMQEQAAIALDGVTELTLYVTGLSVALIEVVKYCDAHGVSLTLMHYNKETDYYYPQLVFNFYSCPFCGHQMRALDRHCPFCGHPFGGKGVK